MGVSKLWTYVTGNSRRETLFEQIDLVEIARSRPNGIRIIGDFYCWEHYMKHHFYKSVSLQAGHPYLILDGGEYQLIHCFIENFITALRKVGIEFVFYLDGAKGTSTFATKQKWATWKRRHSSDQEKLLDVMEFLRGMIPMSSLDKDHLTRPCLQEIQNLLTLQSLGCSLHQCVAGEADSFIAQRMLVDKDAVLIFSNDSDFCIFPGSVFLHNDLFDIDNDLGLGSPSLTVKTPSKLICDVIHSDRLWRHFEFPRADYLVELSVLRGNDFTSPILTKLVPNWRATKVDKIVELVRKHGRAEDCPFYGELIAKHPALREAVNHSRKFYAMELGEEIEDSDDPVFLAILEKVRECTFPSSIISMWKSFYWHRHIMEEPSSFLMPAEEALMPLRAFIYGILLPPDRQAVREYGRSQTQLFDEMLVYKHKDPVIPPLLTIMKNPFHINVRIMEYILSHQEAFRKERSYFEQYGIKRGFVCCLLRYFLLLNWNKNLCIRPKEFQTLCAWVLGQHDMTYFLTMKIVPSPRCITLENWFLLLFRLCRGFLGNMLNVASSLPSPAELFSGATWVALYTATAVTDPNPTTAEPYPLSIPRGELFRTVSYVDNIVHRYRETISSLAEGFFELQT